LTSDDFGASDDMLLDILDEADIDTTVASAGPRPRSERPPELPEKFWNAEVGALRSEALLKSYLELERRLGRSVPIPDEDDREGWDRLYEATGRPESPDDYRIESGHPLIESDAEVNRLLHEAGFSQRQAELVYRLACERLAPAIEHAMAEVEANRQRKRLANHFGGEERWRTLSAQLRNWGQSKLDDQTFEALSKSFDGVIAMAEMMRRQEPALARDGRSGETGVSESELRSLIRDPRYWRDREPEFIARVTQGYKRIYGS